MHARSWLLSLILASTLGGIAHATPTEQAHLVPGETFTVTMEANPSTGYGWSVDVPKTGSVTLLSSTFESQGSKDGQVGRPENQVFTFRAGEPNQHAHLQFSYRRPWEKTGPAAASFAVEVDIGPTRTQTTRTNSFHLVRLHRPLYVALPGTRATRFDWKLNLSQSDPVVRLRGQRDLVASKAKTATPPRTEFQFEGLKPGHVSILATCKPGKQAPPVVHYMGITVVKD